MVIRPRSLISPGTLMSPGSSAPSLKITSCRFGKWLKIFTTTRNLRRQPQNWKLLLINAFPVYHPLPDFSSFDSLLSHVHAHNFLNIKIFKFGPYIAWRSKFVYSINSFPRFGWTFWIIPITPLSRLPDYQVGCEIPTHVCKSLFTRIILDSWTSNPGATDRFRKIIKSIALFPTALIVCGSWIIICWTILLDLRLCWIQVTWISGNVLIY